MQNIIHSLDIYLPGDTEVLKISVARFTSID